MNHLVVERELSRLATNGVVLPERVVEAAQDPTSPLHGEFEWDDAKAAQERRIDQARTLIRSVRLVIRTRTIPFSSVAYVKNPVAAPSEPGYKSLREIVGDDEQASLTIDVELLRLNSIIERVKEIASVLGQVDRVNAYLAEVAGVTPSTLVDEAAA